MLQGQRAISRDLRAHAGFCLRNALVARTQACPSCVQGRIVGIGLGHRTLNRFSMRDSGGRNKNS